MRDPMSSVVAVVFVLDGLWAVSDPIREGFADDPLRQTRWKAFVKKKKAMMPVSLEDTIKVIQQLMQPVVNAIIHNEVFEGRWSHDEQKWVS